MQLFSSNEEGKSVAMAIPAISMAWDSSLCFLTKASEARIAAAPPNVPSW